MLADNGNDVVLYGNIDSVNQEINEHHTNTHYMKNWKLNPNVPATGDLEKALEGAEIVLFVLPTKAVRIVAKNVRKVLDKSGATPLLVTATLVGVEVGGAVKNVIAIASGILVGQGYGDDAKAALMTRGLAEITRLGVNYFGAKPMTFSGLSGIGDLIVTCTSVNSRNWRAGKQIGEGKSLDYVLENMGQVVEGATTVKAVHELAQEKNIDMPISEAIYRVLYENANVEDEIKQMMGRTPKPEIQL